MPVDFLSAEKQARYGRYSGEPTPADVARSFYLGDRDRDLIAVRRGDHHTLGFSLQLCTVRYKDRSVSATDTGTGDPPTQPAPAGGGGHALFQGRPVHRWTGQH